MVLEILAVGLVSAKLFLVCLCLSLGLTLFKRRKSLIVHYKYVTDTEITPQEKVPIKSEFLECLEGNEEAHHLVYRLNRMLEQNLTEYSMTTPNTMMAAGLLTTIDWLLAVSKEYQSKFLTTVL